MNSKEINDFILAMDRRLWAGEKACPDFLRALSALRLCADRIKKSEGIEEFARKKIEERDALEKKVEQLEEEASRFRVARRQMGIWRAKAKRLEAAA